MQGLLILLVGLAAMYHVHGKIQFRVIKQWKYVNYTWSSEEASRNATSVGAYIPDKCIIAGLGYYKGYYYMTTPRMYFGVPATLSRIPENGINEGPLLEPFPSWRKNLNGDCSALKNVQNIEIDAHGYLYAIDSGRINTIATHSSNQCPPKLVKYDLNVQDGEDLAKEIFRYEFPEKVASRNINFLYDLVLDGDYVYISDNSGQDPGLIVFSESEMKSWKIRHGTFQAEKNASALKVSGTVLPLQLNLAGLAIGPEENGERLLYYTPLSSKHLFAVNTKEIKNPFATTLQEVHLVGHKSSQTDGMTVDDKGVIYFGLLGASSVVKWDTKESEFHPVAIAQDSTFVQWPNSFAFNSAGELVVLCNTLAKFLARRMDLNENNFYLLAGNVNARSYVYNQANSTILTFRIAADDDDDDGVSDSIIHYDPEPNESSSVTFKSSVWWIDVVFCAWMVSMKN